MKQVRQRTALIILLIALLAAGMALFCIFYFVHGADWASFSANAHAYTDGTLTSGEILDREGVTLYDPATGEYADSRSLRRATLHAVGDPQNNISTGAKTAFRSRLVGFNPLDRHHDRRSQALSLDRQFPQRDGARPLKRAEGLRRGL